jgi:hypothetical protein
MLEHHYYTLQGFSEHYDHMENMHSLFRANLGKLLSLFREDEMSR